MTLKEIAARIDAHIKRFCATPSIAKPEGSKCPNYWMGGSNAVGRYVSVSYVGYQHTKYLSKADALKYLEWLDAGNVGRHWEALR